MLKKISTAILTVALMVAANATLFARMNGGETDKRPARSAPARPAEQKNWRAIIDTNTEKPFDPASRKSTLAEHQAQQKAGKKFSTTTKVFIGVGIAAAILGVVFVAARNDLEDNILR